MESSELVGPRPWTSSYAAAHFLGCSDGPRLLGAMGVAMEVLMGEGHRAPQAFYDSRCLFKGTAPRISVPRGPVGKAVAACSPRGKEGH